MKHRITFALCLMLAFASGLHATNKDGDIYIAYLKNDFYIQYGTPSIVEISDKLGDRTFISNGTTAKFKGANSSYTGIAAAGYNRYLNPYLYVGAYFGIGEAKANVKDVQTGKIVFSNKIRSYTGMLNVGWTYFRSGIWDISCGISAGIANKDEQIRKINKENRFVPEAKDEIAFAYNFTAARVRVGGGILGGFAEFGFGYKGIANIGVSIRF